MSDGTGAEAGVRRAYDTVASTYARLVAGPGTPTGPEAPLDLAMIDAFVAALAAAGPEPSVLDAGCGPGRMTRHLVDRGLAATGLDLSSGMVAAARRAHPSLGFVVGSLVALPFAAAAFDGVLLWYSTIHAPATDQPRIYAEVARVLRPGGHVLVGFQAGAGTHDTAAFYRGLGHEITLVRHRFDLEQVAGWLAGAGLHETARLQRRPVTEREDQAFVLARKPSSGVGR